MPVADQNSSSPEEGLYSFGTSRVAVTLGTHTLTLEADLWGDVLNDFGNPQYDQLGLSVYALARPTVPVTVRIVGFDTAADWLDADAWPTDVATVLNAAPLTFFSFHACTDQGTTIASGFPGRFTQSAAEPVPEPTSVLLFGTSLLGWGVQRWRPRMRRYRTG